MGIDLVKSVVRVAIVPLRDLGIDEVLQLDWPLARASKATLQRGDRRLWLQAQIESVASAGRAVAQAAQLLRHDALAIVEACKAIADLLQLALAGRAVQKRMRLLLRFSRITYYYRAQRRQTRGVSDNDSFSRERGGMLRRRSRRA